ncbi:MAG: DUF4783 domain-containing protein [Saprospirales bacterium]|nr:DUF4783 domain-containing protein [Saprospirales bacterium]MBK8920702.1 DUF4783 domain-containing protein [Saprospirales bacterium]
MKKLLFLLLFAPLALFADQGNPSLEAIAKALSSGDVEALSQYFADNVEVSILDKEQLYPKAKAKEVVRAFFDANKPKSFSQVHQGTSRENSDQYCIGNMSASTGSYRVYIYLKMSGNSATIQEIRFDKG